MNAMKKAVAAVLAKYQDAIYQSYTMQLQGSFIASTAVFMPQNSFHIGAIASGKAILRGRIPKPSKPPPSRWGTAGVNDNWSPHRATGQPGGDSVLCALWKEYRRQIIPNHMVLRRRGRWGSISDTEPCSTCPNWSWWRSGKPPALM